MWTICPSRGNGSTGGERRADPATLRRDPETSALAEGATLTTIPLIRDTGRPVKANLSLDAGVLAAIDAAAARRKLTRSAFIEAMARETIPKMA